MNCPTCDSNEVEETSKFDLTNISNTSCIHDFECNECNCLFTIEFHPVLATIVEDAQEIPWEHVYGELL